jgi:hypothetical protein
MAKMKITELKRALKDYNQRELIQLISEVYKLNKDVQHYLSTKFVGEEAIEDLFIEARKKIKDEFFPDKGFGKMRLAEAKKAITNFKKLTNDSLRTIDLKLYYVEIGTEFTNTYGDIDERFYYSMESMYSQVVTECDQDEKLFTTFKERLLSVVQDSDQIGWGYHDTLCDLYHSIEWIHEE